MTRRVHVLAKRALSIPTIVVRGARPAPRRWILSFHEVGDHPWGCAPERFEAMLSWIRAEALPSTLANLLSSRSSSRPLVHVTFDDGYTGVADRALPSLRRHGVPATVFLPTALLSEEDGIPSGHYGLYEDLPLLGWARVRSLSSEPLLVFGSHAATHRALPTLAVEEQEEELVSSRRAIERTCGRPPDFLAYPFGASDEETSSAARRVGFSAAVTTRHGGIRRGSDPFHLPRVDVRAGYDVSDLRRIVRGEWDFLGSMQAMRASWSR